MDWSPSVRSDRKYSKLDAQANLFGLAILYYDYLLTFQMEVERYWHFRPFKWHGGVALFFFVRYIGVWGHIPVLISIFLTEHDTSVYIMFTICQELTTTLRCDAFIFYHQMYAVVIQISVGVLLIIRTYALYDRNKRILWVTSAAALLGTAVGCWSVLTKHDSPPSEPSIVGCNSSLSVLQGQRLAIAWGGLLIFDTLIFSLTLWKAFTVQKVGRRTLFDILIRDGAMYFGCMGVANLSNIVTFLIGAPLVKGISTVFTNVLAITLMSRLMLNIRDPKYMREQRDGWSSQARPSTTLGSDLPFISTVYPSTGDTFVSDLTCQYTTRGETELELEDVEVEQ
ncbi:hypothetical protein QCA50_018274 [Cerrena zonata]|uniref:DUF6533 domain-containing protein n=1 Tax=Cerrena zonata TaxID=2478898 RepID=A0AAW0FH97_9APHY